MLDWLGEEGDRISEAFGRVLRLPGESFGSASLHWGGLHTGYKGVQWNVGFDPRTGERWVGVNLEGLRYDGWPLARLIRSEQRKPTLLDLIRAEPDLREVRLRMTREHWAGRNRIHLESIADGALGELSAGEWRRILAEARKCLSSSAGGRATSTYQPLGGDAPVNTDLTPHLAFRLIDRAVDDWTQFIRIGVDRLEPLFEWTDELSGAG